MLRETAREGWHGWLRVASAAVTFLLHAGLAQAQQAPVVRPNTTEIRKSRPAEPAAPSPTLKPSISPEAERPEDGESGRPAAVITATATALDIAADAKATTLTIALTQPVAVSAFTLPDPYRVIIDIADLGFQLPGSPTARGLATGLRYGLLAPGRSRIVIDVSGPVRVAKAETVPSLNGPGAQAVIVLETIDRASFMAALQPPETAPAAATNSESRAGTAGGKPVVVIDPGHGGLDPGALGQNGIREKDLTLAVARQVRAQLAAKGMLDVRMTRRGDEFLSLDQRVAFSEAAGAGLFVSIHADSVGDVGLANAVRGASVYTLSAEASNKQAKTLAEKENAADLRAGFSASAGAGGDQIKSILFDLMQRETQNFSSEIRSLLVANLKRSVAIAKEPARSAAFRVLQQSHVPSVLIELGYLSHTEDAALLQSAEWQKQVAQSIVTAIEQYFSRHASARR